ncbi:tetratricopeptide repeat protein [Azospirillum sp. sgz301742]
MRANLLVVALVLAFGVAISLLLIPRGGELALQRFRDQDFEPALAAYQARFEAGERGAGTVMPLTRLSLMDGNVERAIALMEAYVAREPNQLAGRELLGTLYQHAQRTGDYLDNLEAIARLKPSEDVFRELANTYGFHGDFDRQAEALKRLLAFRPDDFAAVVDLAQLLAARERLAEAAEVLSAADDRANGNIEYDGRVLLTSLLHDLERTDEAFRRAGRWLAEDPPTYAILSLTGLMMEMGRPDYAHRLLAPFTERAMREPPLELMLIDLEIAQGRLEEAQRQLRDWPVRKPVDDASLGRFIALAINAGLPRLALEQVRGRDPHLIPEWAVVGLVETAFRERDRAFLDRLIGELGDTFLAERPVLAGEIALARGDREGAARWAGRAAEDRDLTLSEHMAAVRLLVRADRREAAVAAFDRLAPDAGAADDLLEELGLLFLDLDRAARGLAWFEARRAARPSASADLGWVRLAARAGDAAAVARWLDAHPTLDAGLLQDVANAAVERGAVPLALKAAERVQAQAPTPRSRLALANALVAAGRPAEALGHLRALRDGGGTEVEALYIAALAGAGQTDELARAVGARLASDAVSAADKDQLVQLLIEHKAYREALPHLRERAETGGLEWLYAYADAAMKAGAGAELAAFLSEALERPGLDPKTRDAMAYALLDAAGPAGALPMLKKFADTAPAGPWEGLYRETLTKLGRKDELRRHLVARATDDRMPVPERRALAFSLLELGEKAAAEATFRKLAAGQGVDGPDVRQLLFLWGPRPGPAALDWLEARARAAKPAEQGAWFDKLAEVGGAKRVAAALGPKAAAGAADGALRGSYIEALAAAGKGAELADAVRAALPDEREPDKLRRYARLAERERQMSVSAQAWRALLALRPDDGEALRQVGMLAYGDAKFADAERALGRFLATSDGDYEANYFMGEALVSQKRAKEAEPFQRRALAQVQAMGNRSDAVRQTEANLLHRLGRIDESAALFDKLLAARPTDRQLRADYAAMLIENRRLKEARHVLGQ